MTKCERCNRPIHHNYFPKTVLRVRGQILLSHDPYNYLEREFVLCTRCKNEFHRFMKGKDNERKAD
jgi:hypothetical protein